MMLNTQTMPSVSSVGAKDNQSLMMDDIQQLVQYAKSLLSDLESSADEVSNRLVNVAQRTDDLRSTKLGPTLKLLRAEEGRTLVRKQQDKRFRPSKGLGSSVSEVFKEGTQSAEIVALRNSCRDTPDFSAMEQFVPGCSLKFSNPQFFYEQWSHSQQKESDLEEKKKSEKKRTREQKKKREQDISMMSGDENKEIPSMTQDRATTGQQKRPPRPPTTNNIQVSTSQVMNPVSVTVDIRPDGLKRPARPRSTMVSAFVPDPVASVTVALQPGTSMPARPPRRVVVGSLGGEAQTGDSVSSLTSSTGDSDRSVGSDTLAPPPLPPRDVVVNVPAPIARPSRPRTQPAASPQPTLDVGLKPISTTVALTDTFAQSATPPSMIGRTVLPPPPSPSPPPTVFDPVRSSQAIEPAQQPQLEALTKPTRKPRPVAPAPPPNVIRSTSKPAIESSRDLEQVKSFDTESTSRPKRALAPASPKLVQSSAFEEEEPMSKRPAPPLANDFALSNSPLVEHQQQISSYVEEAHQIEEERSPFMDDPVLKKFAMMQKLNLPQGAIEQAMIRVNVDPALLFGTATMAKLGGSGPNIVIPQRSSEVASPREQNRPTNVMQELMQGGAQLRKVEVSEVRSPGTSAASSQSELMQGIMEGRNKLKKVEAIPEVKKAPSAVGGLDGGGVASILARRIAIIGDKGSDSESEDGSDWGDDGND